MAPRKILIVGATSQQGQATIAALNQRSPTIEILGLTRSVSSPKGQALQKKFPNITLVEGDVRAPEPVFAARALLDPEEWHGKAVGLASCEMSFEEVRVAFREVVKKELPMTWAVVAKSVLWWVPDAKTSFEWFRESGYGADIEALRKMEPGMQDFRAWLRESSRWSVQ